MNVNALQAIEAIDSILSANLVPCLNGAPGGGKSAIFEEVAKKRGMVFYPILLSLLEPIEIMGLYDTKSSEEVAKFKPLELFYVVYSTKKPTLVLLDEFGQSSKQNQAACIQLIHSGRLNGYTVSPFVKFAIATNRSTDKAGATELITPIQNRIIQMTLENICNCNPFKMCGWHQWAAKNNIFPTVYAFIKTRQNFLNEFENSKHLGGAFCSPRSLEFLSKLERSGLPKSCELEVISGTIGERAGVEYFSYKDVWTKFPDKNEVYTKPMEATIPPIDQLDILIAYITSLAYEADEKTADNIIMYFTRLPVEISVMGVLTIYQRLNHDILKSLKAWNIWAKQNCKFIAPI